jgi:hypothetical protein
MPNEIVIHVKAVNDTKVVFDKIRAEAKDLGETIAININEKVTERLQRDAQAATSSGGGYARTGDMIGDTIGKHISDRISEKIRVSVNDRVSVDDHGREHVSNRETIHVEVDVDKQSLLQKLASFGAGVQDKISGWFEGGLSTGISSVFSGDIISTVLKGALITFAVGVLAPTLAAALGAAVLTALSGGAIGIGIVAALSDPRIKGALNSLKEQAKSVFTSFGENFKGPLEEFIAPSNGGDGGIVGLFRQLTPLIEHLGQVLGPIAGQLGNGIIGLLQNVLPAIIRAAEAGAPLVQTLADRLPGIGDAIGDFFNEISAHADDADTFFNDLLRVVEFLIRAIGWLVGGFMDMYSTVRGLFVALTQTILSFVGVSIHAMAKAFGWIPGLGPKLNHAASQFDSWAGGVVRSLNKVPDHKYVNVHLRVIFDNVWAKIHEVTRALQAIGAVGHAFGGVIGTAASGGARGGLTLVGERGPELINAAPGSQVYSNADSARMISQAGSGNGGTLVINLVVDGMVIAKAIADPMRKMVLNQYGGNVQTAYGR